MHNAIPKNFRGLLILYVTASMTGGGKTVRHFTKNMTFLDYTFLAQCVVVIL